MNLATKRGSWEAPATKLAEWATAYPLADLSSEFLRMQAWLDDYSNRQPKNFALFVRNWLDKAQKDAEAKGRVLKNTGAYVEFKGARGESAPGYGEAYWKARDEGFSIEAAARIAKKKLGLDK